MGEELEPRASTDVALAEEIAKEASADVKSQIDQGDVILPLVKLTQALSGARSRGDAEEGEYINALTGENYGESFEFVIVKRFKGRFYAPKGGGSFATPLAVAPSNWPEEYAGQAFVDIPDAEEQWAAAANEGGEWGDGPPISTTYNYVGFLAKDVGGQGAPIPVRLSFMRTGRKVARQIDTLLTMATAPWERKFVVGRVEATNKSNQPYFEPTVHRGDPPTPDEAATAVELYTLLRGADVQLVGEEEPEAPGPEPEDGGGMAVA